MRSRVWRAIPVALAAGLVMSAGVALAHTDRFRTELQNVTGRWDVHLDAGEVTGTVSSPREGCIAGRTVRLYVKVDGNWDRLARTTSDSDGFFRFDGLAGGTYRVRVTRENIGAGDHRHICRSATSDPVEIVEGPPT